jgi:hypothetical protein
MVPGFELGFDNNMRAATVEACVVINYVSRKGKINSVSVHICVDNIGHDDIKRPVKYMFITVETGLV